jgi:hypothetical protein
VQERETEEPRRVGRNDAFGFGNILKHQASIREKPISDFVGTDEQTHKASVGVASSDPSSTMTGPMPGIVFSRRASLSFLGSTDDLGIR